MSVWAEKGKLTYEYNAFQIERPKLLPTGKVKIEVESCRGQVHAAPFDIVIRANEEEIASGKVPRSASIGFTPNDTFDVGRDSYSPVSDASFDHAPFAFNGRIAGMTIEYIK